MKTKSIGFIGGGRITGILLQAFKQADIQPAAVKVFDVNAETLATLRAKFTHIQVAKSLDDVLEVELLFLAVHPPMVVDVLASIRGKLSNDCLLVSLAPKFTLSKMSEVLGGFSNLARMNPSASSFVGKGVNPVCFGEGVQEATKTSFMELVEPFGYTPLIEESKMEAYAVVSAMGHTYFFFQLQKLKELAVSFGMDELEAEKTVTNMLWGTTETLFNSGLTYSEVVNLVPVKPMGEVEEVVKGYFDQYLTGIYQKIKP